MEVESNRTISTESCHKITAVNIDQRGKARIMPWRLRESLSIQKSTETTSNQRQNVANRRKSSSSSATTAPAAAAALYGIDVSVAFHLDCSAIARNVNQAIKTKVKVITFISMSSLCECVLSHSFFIQFV